MDREIHKRKSMSGMILLLVIWMFVTVLFMYKVYSDSYTSFTVKLDGQNESKDIGISLVSSKSWTYDEGMLSQHVGAQYDGTIENKSGGDIINWNLVAIMPESGRLDSYWNGEYSVKDGKLVLMPNQFISVIPKGEKKTFGFIMISEELQQFEEFEFTGYRKIEPIQSPMFWILAAFICIWGIVFVSRIYIMIKTRHFEERREMDAAIISQTMNVLIEMIDAKDSYTKGHSIRVSHYAKEIGRRMHFSEDDVTKLGYIALMHDCGKMGIPDNVLRKPDKLKPEERNEMREHTVLGGKMLENFTAIEGIKEGALYHHERYDGTGYPEGLKGEEIPLFARIICVADSYDTMSSDRCYRTHLSKERILQELEENKGTQFDPDIVKHMIDMILEGFCNPDDTLNV